MAKKSIIEIDVNDTKFKAFLERFESYRQQIGATSKQWEEAGKTIGAAFLAASQTMEKSADRQKKAAEGVAGAWHKVGSGIGQLASKIDQATISLLKWSTVWGTMLGLVGVGGSLFGLERLAASAAGSRRSATGLGLSIGEQKAFGVQYGQLVDESKLAELQNARYDYSRRGAFAAMGVYDPEQGSAAELAIRMMARAKQLYRPGMSEQELQASGVGQFFSREELNRLRSANLSSIESGYRRDVGQLGYSDEIARNWQQFNVKLRESGETIEKALIVSLGKLEQNGTLSHLSDAIVKLVEALGDSPRVKQWIDDLADSLEKLAGWLGKVVNKAPAQDWQNMSYTDRMAYAAIHGTDEAGELNRINRGYERAKDGTLRFLGRKVGTGAPYLYHNPGNIMRPGSSPGHYELMKYGSDEEGLVAMGKLLQRYQRRFNINTVEGFIRKYDPDPHDNIEAYIRDVTQRTGFKRGERIDVSNIDVLSRLEAAMTKHEDVRTNFTPTQVKLAIENKTGSNVVVNAKAASVTASGGQ